MKRRRRGTWYPRLYDSQDASGWLVGRAHGTAGALYDDLYRHPHTYGLRWDYHWTVSDAIYQGTGYRVCSDRDYFSCLSHYSPSPTGWLRLIRKNHLEPAYDGWHRYYWRRDLLKLLLPRESCCRCGRKTSRHYQCEELDCSDIFWSGTMNNESWSGRAQRERLKEYVEFYREHANAPTCSRECHHLWAWHYRRQIEEHRRQVEWTRQTRELLKAVRTTLREQKQNQKRREVSLSQTEVSARQGTCAT